MKLGFVSGTEVVHAQSYYQPRKQRQHLHVRSVARKASGTRQTERDGERERERELHRCSDFGAKLEQALQVLLGDAVVASCSSGNHVGGQLSCLRF